MFGRLFIIIVVYLWAPLSNDKCHPFPIFDICFGFVNVRLTSYQLPGQQSSVNTLLSMIKIIKFLGIASHIVWIERETVVSIATHCIDAHENKKTHICTHKNNNNNKKWYEQHREQDREMSDWKDERIFLASSNFVFFFHADRLLCHFSYNMILFRIALYFFPSFVVVVEMRKSVKDKCTMISMKIVQIT